MYLIYHQLTSKEGKLVSEFVSLVHNFRSDGRKRNWFMLLAVCIVTFLNRLIQDLSDHRASKELKNLLLAKILWFL